MSVDNKALCFVSNEPRKNAEFELMLSSRSSALEDTAFSWYLYTPPLITPDRESSVLWKLAGALNFYQFVCVEESELYPLHNNFPGVLVNFLWEQGPLAFYNTMYVLANMSFLCENGYIPVIWRCRMAVHLHGVVQHFTFETRGAMKSPLALKNVSYSSWEDLFIPCGSTKAMCQMSKYDQLKYSPRATCLREIAKMYNIPVNKKCDL